MDETDVAVGGDGVGDGGGVGRRRRHRATTVGGGGRNLRGNNDDGGTIIPRSSSSSETVATTTTTTITTRRFRERDDASRISPIPSIVEERRSLLRGRDDVATTTTTAAADHRRDRRRTLALPDPHLVFRLRIYAKYAEEDMDGKKSNEASYSPAIENEAGKLSEGFGEALSCVFNNYRYEMVGTMRARSGYGRECNPVGSGGGSSSSSSSSSSASSSSSSNGDNNNNNADPLLGEEYTEINVGVVNRFDCDKLLPLYYYELNSLAARVVDDDDDDVVGGSGGEEDQLNGAMARFGLDDGHCLTSRFPGATGSNDDDSAGSSGGRKSRTMPTWIIGVIIAIVVTLVLLFVAAVLYVQRERAKLLREKERRRLTKMLKMERRKEKRRSKGKSKIGREEDNGAADGMGALLAGDPLGKEGAPDDDEAAHPTPDESEAEFEGEATAAATSFSGFDSILESHRPSNNFASTTTSSSRRSSDHGVSSTPAGGRGAPHDSVISRRSSVGYESDDGELNRLFASRNAGVVREKGVVAEGAGDVPTNTTTITTRATGEQHHPSTPPRKSKKGKGGSRRRRKKNPDHHHPSESDSNNSSELESREASGAPNSGDGGGGEEAGAHGGNAANRGELEKERPRRIKRGIRNLSVRLTSSLLRSVSHNALGDVDDNPIDVVADVDAGGMGRGADDAPKAKIKRKPRHTTLGRIERGYGGGDGENQDDKNGDSAGLSPTSRRKRRPKKLDNLVSSFRQSLQVSFTGDNLAANAGTAAEERKQKKLSRVKGKEAASPINPKKGRTMAMNSMKMSMRKILIGELSDDSDYSSSSSENDSSNSDDDDSSNSDDDSSSSSSSDSDDSFTGRPKSRNQMQKAVSSMLVYEIDDNVAPPPQKHRRHTTVQIRQIHDNSHVGHHKQEQHHQHQHANHLPQQHQVHRQYEAALEALDVPRNDATDKRLVQANADGSSDRRPGTNRHMDQGNTAELHESELTQTNDYLPHGRLDTTPEEATQQHHPKGRRPSERPSERSARSKSRSSRSNASDQSQRPVLPKGKSQRSMGSRSQSSRSVYSAQWQESPSNSDQNGSRPSTHKQGPSRSSRPSGRGGGTRQENARESEEGEGGRNHHNQGGGTAAAKQRKSKLKRHTNALNSPEKRRDGSHQTRRNKEHPSHRRKKLSQLKSSLTSSLSSLTQGKSLSDTAALALKDSRIGGEDHRAKGSQHGSSRPRSTRGPSRGGRVASERGDGDRGGGATRSSSHARHSPTRSGVGSEKQRKKSSSSTKDKQRPLSSNKTKHSKHKGGGGGRGAQQHHPDVDEGDAKKSKKKAASSTAVAV